MKFIEHNFYYIKHKSDNWSVISQVSSITEDDVNFEDRVVVTGPEELEYWNLSHEEVKSYANFVELGSSFSKNEFPEYFL